MNAADVQRSPRAFRRRSTSGGTNCCVPGCTNTSEKDKAEGKKLSYYSFPLQDHKRTKLWLAHIRRENWFPKTHTKICSVHFEGGKKSNNSKDAAFVPTLFPSRQRTTTKRTTRNSRTAGSPTAPPPAKRRILNTDIADPTPVSMSSPITQPEDCPLEVIPEHAEITPLTDPVSYPTEPATNDAWQRDHDYISTTLDPTPFSDDYIQLQEKVQSLTSEVEDLKKKVLSISSVRDNASDFRYMTGFHNYTQFEAVCEYLHDRCSGNLMYWNGQLTSKYEFVHDKSRKPGPARKLSFEDEFFLTLVKLRRGLDNRDLSMRLGVSDSTVSRIITTWVNFLNNELTHMFELPAVESSSVTTMPAFNDFPDVQIVLDCTELFSDRSSDLLARKETFSNYKHHDTVKFLVGMSPYQAVTFVSSAWGGRASDKHITLNSDNLLSSLGSGDSVMADRGFSVTEELAKLGVKVIMLQRK